MFLDPKTKIDFVGNWARDKNVEALITHLGPMPQEGWRVQDLIEFFTGFDIMINHPKADPGKIYLWVDAPGQRFSQR